MNWTCRHPMLTLLLIGLAVACGEQPDDKIILSGRLEGQVLTEHPDEPVLVAVLRHDASRSMAIPSLSEVIKMISVDKSDYSFRMDLAETGLRPGDAINLVAFVDLNFKHGLPLPDAGDKVGFHIDADTYSPAYVLRRGMNAGLNIRVNRVIGPYRTRISGTVEEDIAGELLIVAYVGDIDSMDFASWDVDQVVGYARKYKGAAELNYTLDVLPYPEAPENEDLLIIALLDDGHVGIPAPGNLVGFHANPQGTAPQRVSIETRADSHLTGVDIRMLFAGASDAQPVGIRIPYPSGDTIFLGGQFHMPPDVDPDQGALFLIVAQTDNPLNIMASPLPFIRYFQRMPGQVDGFSLDLSATGLSLADEVMVMALWDRDWRAGFPELTPGDMLGLAQNKAQLTMALPLSQCQEAGQLPEGWDLSINKIIYSHAAAIRFQTSEALGIVPEAGETIIVFAVERQGIDLSPPAVDMDYIVGMARAVVGQDGPPYTLDILPAIHNGIDVSEDPFGLSGLHLVAILDNAPANGAPDEGEYIGFTLLPFAIEDGVNAIVNRVTFPGDRFVFQSP